MLSLEYHKRAEKFMKKLKDKTLTRRLLAEIENLRENPFPKGRKRVEGYIEKIYRVRIGDYRILYYVDPENKTLWIFDIDKRSRVY